MNPTKQNNQAQQTGTLNENRPCIWMQSGVVSKKYCTSHYDCATCRYDAAMGAQAAAGRHLSWQDALRRKESFSRTCRHALTHRSAVRTCPLNYNCFKCEFDQLFEDTLSPGTGHASLEMMDVKGFKLPSDFYFHDGHTWATLENGGFIRVGMDDFAFKVLGQPDGFDLPLTGQELSSGIPGWGMRRGKHFADVRSPVDGVITAVNPAVYASPDLPGKTPYQDGWLFTVHNRDIKAAVKGLMGDASSQAWMDSEVTALEEMIEHVAGPLSADGGVLTRDVYGHLPGLGWENLTRIFLGT